MDTKHFTEMPLDQRLRDALPKQTFTNPMPIQAKAIPLALAGNDLMIQAPTGTGKTLAFVIPALQKVLETGRVDGKISVIVLVPTKELCLQVTEVFEKLCCNCWDSVDICRIGDGSVDRDTIKLKDAPDVVISTPTRLKNALEKVGNDLVDCMKILIIDEADLVLDYGYDEDLKKLLLIFPKLFQTILLSATLTPEVDSLKQLVLQKPVTVRLSVSQDNEKSRVEHYVIDLQKCNKKSDDFLLVFALLKLKVVKGKTIFFVNSIDRGFHLKLFLEAFSIRSAVLNSELPATSREKILKHFNAGLFDLLIATDKGTITDGEDDHSDEYGVGRGVDFKNVTNVINFDFPESLKSYIHRAGRTARCEKLGTVLSFRKRKCDEVVDLVRQYLGEDGLQDLQLKIDDVNMFRYRVEGILMKVTRGAIKEARLKEIRQEILNSEKLQAFFEDNPKEAELLKHDKVLRPKEIQPQLKYLPNYLMSKCTAASDIPTISKIGKRKFRTAQFRKMRKRNRRRNSLKTFNAIIPTAGDLKRQAKRHKKKK